jgi:hypothetical protein
MAFKYKIFGYQGHKKRPRDVFAIVFGEKYHFQDQRRQLEDFERLLRVEATRKFSFFDRTRHNLAGLFVKKPLMDFKYYNNISIFTNFARGSR